MIYFLIAFDQEVNQFTKTAEGDLVGQVNEIKLTFSSGFLPSSLIVIRKNDLYQVIAALTPSITDAVAAALAGQSQTTVTITQQAQVTIF